MEFAVEQYARDQSSSSTCSIISSVPHINAALEKLNLNMELDGELYSHGDSFETINGIASRTLNLHEDYHNLHYHVFDTISDNNQLERLLQLKQIKNFNSYLEIVPIELAYTFQDIMRIYERFLSQDYEGIIVRHRLAAYVRKRSRFVLKFKPKKSDIYKVVGASQMLDKNNNPKPLLGALTCTSDEGTIFSVGSGMSEVFRREIWKDPSTLIGKFCKISYQHLTSKGSPRFPIFIEILDENLEEEPLNLTEGIL